MPDITLRTRLGAAIKAAGRAMRFGGSQYANHYIGRWPGMAGSFDYAVTAADLMDNSIVAATLGWVGRTYPEAPIRVVRETAKGDEAVPGHPLAALLKRPNPYYSGAQMWNPVLMSYILDGNAYLLKERTNGGDVLNLWYVPHWQMEPRWPADGSRFISHYDYRVDGRVDRWPVEDVIHLPNGRDPRNMRKGLSPLKAALRLVYTDNEITRYESAMLRNRGTPGAVISPKTADQTLKEEEAAFVKQQYIEKTTGERQGEPLISLAAIDVNFPSFSPADMNLHDMRRTPEERISALIGIPALVIGLGVGLERSTYANYQQSREAAYESWLMPVQSNIDEELTTQLMPDFGGDSSLKVAHDYAKVRVLQPDADKLAERAARLFGAGMIDRARSLALIGEEARPEDEGIYLLPRGASFSDGSVAEPVSPEIVKVNTEPGAPPAQTNGKKPTDAAALATLTKTGAMG